jgi:SPP1 family predicted phage head-tail adaptor
MRSNELRHSITIQSKSKDRDEYGQPITVWTTLGKDIRAKITPVSGRERMAAQATRAEVSSIVSIRYQARFADPIAMAANRILYGSRILNIADCRDVDERHFEIEFSCSEGVNDG